MRFDAIRRHDVTCCSVTQLAAGPLIALADPTALGSSSGTVETTTSAMVEEVKEVVPTVKLEGELAAQFQKVRIGACGVVKGGMVSR